MSTLRKQSAINESGFSRDANLLFEREIISPEQLDQKFPLSVEAERSILENREAIWNIVRRSDKRFLVFAGPCSIHDQQQALEYARNCLELASKVEDKIVIVMRAYLQKPRSILGWKGFINDPDLDGTCDMEAGICRGRTLLNEVAELGLPIACEILDPIISAYIEPCISWTAIGARTVESPTQRELLSGVATPIGLKNSIEGNFQVAIDALQACSASHTYLSVAPTGKVSVRRSKGNPHAHLVIRGGRSGPMYHPDILSDAIQALRERDIPTGIVVDCNHGNTGSKQSLQSQVVRSVLEFKNSGHDEICGVMLESNLMEGKQQHVSPNDLEFGVSLTDECMSWETTQSLIKNIYDELR